MRVSFSSKRRPRICVTALCIICIATSSHTTRQFRTSVNTCHADKSDSSRLEEPLTLTSRHGEKGGPCFVTFVRLGQYGRLGNQLFQTASTIGIAEKNGLAWKLPAAVQNASIGRLFQLTGSNLTFDELDEYRENNGTFYDIRLDQFTKKGISLLGYFQSPQYFSSSVETLRKVFKIREELVHRVVNEVPQLLGNSVTLHIRRGDYVTLSHLYTLLGKGYYQVALERLHGIDTAIIVSDDIEWCKVHLSPAIQVNVVYSPFKDELLDFVLLFLGKHSIIANSSFSWWSAYLKMILKPRGEQGQTFAPRPWYNPSGSLRHLNTDDLYLESWQVIDA